MAKMIMFLTLLLILIPSIAIGADNDLVLRVGKGVSPPKVLHKVDPAYSKKAEVEKARRLSWFTRVPHETK